MIKYINNEGEVLNLSAPPYVVNETSIFDFEWSYDSVGTGNKKSNITKLYRNSKTGDLKIFVHDDDVLSRMAEFYEITEKDVIVGKPGKLVLDNGEYLSCFLVKSNHARIFHKFNLNEQTVTVVSPYPFWITEAKKQFAPISREEIEDDYLDYPYDYSYDYSFETPGVRTWNLDHYATSGFKLTIYGYCENPRILVNGYPYQIFGTVEENEFLVIDSREKTVTHYLNNGTTENWFDFRNKENSVFEPLPSGDLTLTWDGTYGFDILAYLERSEPRWT